MNFLKGFLVTLSSLVIIVFFFLFYFDSDRLQIRNIKISSNIGFFPDGADKDVKNLVSGNMLLLDKFSVIEKIKELSSDIEDVDVIIYPPDTVSVDITYREPVIRVIGRNGISKFFDKNFNDVREYSKGIFSNVVVVFAEVWNEAILKSIAGVVSMLDTGIINNKFFTKTFVIKSDGIYGMNPRFGITVFFGESIDYDKVKKSFIVVRYVIQRSLPIKFIDARFDNIIGK